jgi:hypothetical protein
MCRVVWCGVVWSAVMFIGEGVLTVLGNEPSSCMVAYFYLEVCPGCADQEHYTSLYVGCLAAMKMVFPLHVRSPSSLHLA